MITYSLYKLTSGLLDLKADSELKKVEKGSSEDVDYEQYIETVYLILSKYLNVTRTILAVELGVLNFTKMYHFYVCCQSRAQCTKEPSFVNF